jgi:acetoin utilization deacetylase AcuC-like enzyme
MHQWNNYPAEKPPSTIDVHLPDGTGDAEYLERLREVLPAVAAHRPDLVMYLAGADPFHDDQLGGLSLSQAGLRERDRAVLDSMRAEGIPVAVTLAGGYARRLEDTVAIHVATVEEALDAWQAAKTDAATGRS